VSTSLYVSNLPFAITAAALEEKFSHFGTVLSVKVKPGPENNRTRSHGFVEMKTAEEARKAEVALNATPFEGRLVAVNRAARS
jgi:RNA recognition motif-containing protein